MEVGKINIPVTNDDFNEKKWKEARKLWEKKIKNVTLPKDLASSPEMIVKAEYELDLLHSEASYLFSKYRAMYENMEDYIDAVKYVYRDKGNNPEERKSRAYKMLIYYPYGEERIDAQNLIEIRNRIRERYYFFRDFVIATIKAKRDALNTDIGAGKIESQIISGYGASA